MGVFKKRNDWWVDYYDADGRRRRKKIGPQKTLANLTLKDIKLKIAKGEFLGIYEEKKVSLRDFALRVYLPHVKTHLSAQSFNRHQGIIKNHLIAHFDGYLYKVSRKQVEDFKQKRAGEVSPATVNLEVSRLRHMLQCAVNWGYLKSNPCKGVKELREPPGRVRYLTGEEMERLLEACDPESLRKNPQNAGRTFSKMTDAYLKPIVQIAFHTGMRRGEIMSLRWRDVDLKERRVILDKTKNNERRVVPLNETLYEILRSLPIYLHSEMVFPETSGNMLTVAFKRACKRAGISDFRFHDLRHTCASYLTMGGVNLRTVQTLLGHKDLRMTVRYSHLSPEYLREAVSTLEKGLRTATIPVDQANSGKSCQI